MHLAAIAEKYGLDQSGDVNEILLTALAAEKAGISLELVAKHTADSESSELFDLERNLHKTVIGQAQAVTQAASLVKKSLGLEPGIPPRTRPLSMLFTGPSGVGKATLALELGRIISAGKEETAIFDLASTGGDKLLDLAGPIRRTLQANPFKTILFQHAECGDSSFYEILSVLLSDRRMPTDSGSTIDIGNAVFILSTGHFSNTEPPSPGSVEKLDKKSLEKIKAFFPLALLEQIDGVILFRHLDEASCTRLLLSWIDMLRLKVRAAGSELHVGRDVERFLLTKGESGRHGAKKLRILFDEMFGQTLNGLLLKGEIARHKDWRALMADNHISFVPKIYESQKNEEEQAPQ